MKLRTTIILLLLAGGMLAYIEFVEKKTLGTRAAREQSLQVMEFDRDKINTISIQSPENKIELRKNEANVWLLDAPVKDRADGLAIAQLLTSAESLKHDAVIDPGGKGADNEHLKEFGVVDPETRIRFAGSEKTVELLIGKDAAVEGKVYARLEGAEKVYVIPNDLKNQITKKADDFRDRKLISLDARQVTKLVIKRGADEIELEKKEDDWSIVKPLKARADNSKVGDLISQATTARIETFVADSANLAAFGLQEPRGTLTLFSEGAKDPVILQIGGNPTEEKEKEKVYARLSSRDSVVVLPKAVAELLETKPNDIRDKSLLRFESDIVDRISIEPAGGEKLVLARNGEQWVRKGEKDLPVNAALATRLLDDLKAQQVAAFASDVATDLPKFGLDQPPLRLTLSSFASENTAETAAGEKSIVTLLFGKIEGDNVFAKIEEEPFIVAVPKTILESIPSDPIQWRELTIYDFKPEQIVSIEVNRADQPGVSLERDKETWKLSKGDGNVNQITVQSLVNTLAMLRAVRWVGTTTPEHGFKKPTLVVTFKAAENNGGSLTVGGSTPERMSYATAEGMPGTFIISKPHLEALQLPLLEKPSASPATAPPPTPAVAPGVVSPATQPSIPPPPVPLPETVPAPPQGAAPPQRP